MSYLKSIALAAISALAILGVSGQLAPVNAEPSAFQKPQAYSGPGACDLRCRTGFFGYR